MARSPADLTTAPDAQAQGRRGRLRDQSITDLAHEKDAKIQVDEFRTLNRCLDNAIANAVTEFAYQRDFAVAVVVVLDAGEVPAADVDGQVVRPPAGHAITGPSP